MVENGTLTTLPYDSVGAVASILLAALELSTGAWPGDNQAAGRLAFVSNAPATVGSPYQVLRVANCSAGMVNFGI
jgi:hypothetical protein